jgi:hypothetical protein
MSREKKSQVDDITKLRKILDNPSDPSTKNFIAEDEKALDSIRRHLVSMPTAIKKTEQSVHGSVSLEPKVTVYPKVPINQQRTIAPPSFQLVSVQPPPFRTPSPSGLPEFELVSPTSSLKEPAQPSVSFTTEELYEVEKVEPNIVQFHEVTSDKLFQGTTMTPLESMAFENALPEWQPVSENRFEEPQEQQSTATGSQSQQVQPPIDSTPDTSPTPEAIPEFERIEPPVSQTAEKPDEWEMLSPTQPVEEPKEFRPAEPSETVSQPLTKKQQRAAKKEEKWREKEAKKQKKLELKNLQLETREKEREARRLTQEQQSIHPLSEAQPTPSETMSTEQPPTMDIDTTVFRAIESVDEKTAVLLVQNGYFSLEALNDAAVDDLVKIRGIKRKLAKQIKKEVQQKIAEQPQLEFIPLKEKAHRTKSKKTSDDMDEWESYHVDDRAEASASRPRNVCIYRGYTLYKRVIRKAGGKKTAIHFFSKEKPKVGDPISLPRGYRITVNKKTGVPYLKKNT